MSSTRNAPYGVATRGLLGGSAPSNLDRPALRIVGGHRLPNPLAVYSCLTWGSPGHYAIRSHLMKGWQPIQADATWSRASGV